ncbi:hypothetical protein TNCV_2658291 [Trichonephila clavipes]|nr:hypothetical protein TNCV_2658291 [Trichonephila clavipes]
MHTPRSAAVEHGDKVILLGKGVQRRPKRRGNRPFRRGRQVEEILKKEILMTLIQKSQPHQEILTPRCKGEISKGKKLYSGKKPMQHRTMKL